MAALEVIDGSAPEVVGEVLSIPTGQIEVKNRLRPVDPVAAEALAAVMKVEGQRTPAEVCRLPGKANWRLVTGAHRHAGCAINGVPLRAIQVSADALDRRQAEISENLFRRGLDPLDRAAFVADLIELQRARAGVAETTTLQSVAAQARWQKALKQQSSDAIQTIGIAYGFTADIADKIGLSRQTIYNDLTLHKRLLPDVVAKLRGHPVASNASQLRLLARESEADQRAIAGLIGGGKVKSVSEGLATIRQKPRPDPETKAWNAFFGAWSRMPARRRREALAKLVEQGLPSGIRIVTEEQKHV